MESIRRNRSRSQNRTPSPILSPILPSPTRHPQNKHANHTQLLPSLPPAPKRIADYDSATEARKDTRARMQQMVQSGLIKVPDWTGCSRTEISIPMRDGSVNRGIVMRRSEGEVGGLYVSFVFFVSFSVSVFAGFQLLWWEEGRNALREIQRRRRCYTGSGGL